MGIWMSVEILESDNGGVEVKVLSEVQYRCIELLCQPDPNITAIAKELEVDRKTIYNWLKNEKFKAELNLREQEIKDEVRRIYIRKLPAVIEKLYKLTDSSDKRTALSAIQSWIDRALGKVSTQVELTDNRANNDDFDINAALSQIKQDLNAESKKNDKNIIPLSKAE